MFCQSTTELSFYLLGYSFWFQPLAFITLLAKGFWEEVCLGFGLSFIVYFIILGLMKGGFYRYLALRGAACAGLLFTIFIAGYQLFSWYFLEKISSLSLPQFFSQRHQETLLWQHFLNMEELVFLAILLGIVYFWISCSHPSKHALGNAHFASAFEIQKAGFLKKEEQSLIIGKKFGLPLYANGFEHVLVFAPTGSGKTRSIGIPNLFHYPYSVVCNDVKLSLFQTTAAYREKFLGQRCYCWAPAKREGKTHRYNPLSFISDDKTARITDIQKMAHILIPDQKQGDPIWQQASRKLFKIAVLYLLDTAERPKTLGEINRLIKQPCFDDWLATTLEERTDLDPDFYRNAYSYLNNHEKTRSSILETFSGYFELFEDPIVDAATSVSDFNLRELRKEKISIYIGFTDDDLERLSPLLTLFWQQLISVMIQKIPDPKEEPYPLLCLMDEFSSLGRIERLRRSLKLLREYRVRCVLMLQYIAQTYEQYSQAEAKAFTNIKTKIAFAAEDLQDAEYISKLLGMRTLKLSSGSSTQGQGQSYSESNSYSYQAVPLLRPEEVMLLPKNQTLIMQTGEPPVKAEQFIWYQEKTMKNINK